jgi:RimJ/RimL family protein N-acetyltransferase
MMNYYVYLALARGRSNALLAEAEAAGRAGQARRYRQRAGASGGRRSALGRLFRGLRPAWSGWPAWPGRAARAAGGRVAARWVEALIRPVSSEDASLLADGFARLSPESRRRRFLRRKDELSAAGCATHRRRPPPRGARALDRADGRGVGIARYVRDTGDPQSAEIAVTVVDDWQGRGLGAEPLARLSRRARTEGIRRFTALVSADNAAMAALLRSVSASPVHREYGTVEYEITLTPCEEPRDGVLVPVPC